MSCVLYSKKQNHILIGNCASTPAEDLCETRNKKTSRHKSRVVPTLGTRQFMERIFPLKGMYPEAEHETAYPGITRADSWLMKTNPQALPLKQCCLLTYL